jgi:hypothetical protein
MSGPGRNPDRLSDRPELGEAPRQRAHDLDDGAVREAHA